MKRLVGKTPRPATRRENLPAFCSRNSFLVEEDLTSEKRSKTKKAPHELFRVMRRPNSPPPELLNRRVRLAPRDVNSTLVLVRGTIVTILFLPFSTTFPEWDSPSALGPWLRQ